MFEKVKLILEKRRAESQIQFNNKIESSHDKLAKEIEWKSLNKGSSNFKNRFLSHKVTGDIVFKPTIFSIIFGLIFLFSGLLIIYFLTGLNQFPISDFFYNPISGIKIFFQWLRQSINSESIFILLFGSIFFLIGLALLYTFVKPIGFSSRGKFFYKGFTFLKHKIISFNDIHAIQLLSSLKRSSKSSYMTYEVNLVLKNKERVNVVTHPKVEAAKRNADELSSFLSVPVWDMS